MSVNRARGTGVRILLAAVAGVVVAALLTVVVIAFHPWAPGPLDQNLLPMDDSAHTSGPEIFTSALPDWAGMPRKAGRFAGMSLRNPAFDADGDRMLAEADPVGADGTAHRTLGLWDMFDPREPRLAATFDQALGAGRHPVDALALSPDATRAAVCVNSTITLWSIWHRSRPLNLGTVPGSVDAGCSATFSPDGKLLATTDARRVHLWNVRTGNPRPAGSMDAGAPDGAQFTPDGTGLLTTGPQDALLWDISDRAHPKLRHRFTDASRAVLLSDYRVVTLTSEGRLRIFDAAAPAKPLWQSTGDRLDARDLVVDRAHYRVVTAGAAGRGAVPWQLWTSGGDLRMLTRHTVTPGLDPAAQLVLSPDGRNLIAGDLDGATRVWSMPTQVSRTTIILGRHGTPPEFPPG